MRGLSVLLRLLCVAVLAVAFGGVTAGSPIGPLGPRRPGAPYETLMVPSARDGPRHPGGLPGRRTARGVPAGRLRRRAGRQQLGHRGQRDGHAGGKGISVVAPAGGAFSMYTNWEQDGSKQWDTFLSSELPDWLAANKGLAPGGHGAVGASQGGYAAMALAAFHPDRFGFAGSLSGFLYPSDHLQQRRDPGRPAAIRRCGRQRNVGSPTAGPVEVARPVGARRVAGAEQHPGLGLEPDQPRRQQSRRHDRRGRRRDGQQPGVLPAVPRASAGTTATSTSRAAVTTAGARGQDSWVPCRATSSAPFASGAAPARL